MRKREAHLLGTFGHTMRNERRRVYGAVILGFLFVVLVANAVLLGSGRQIAGRLVMDWAGDHGIQLSIAGVSFEGMGRIVLHDVRADLFSDDGVEDLAAERVALTFDLVALLRGIRGKELISEVDVKDGSFILSGRDGAARGQFELRAAIGENGVQVSRLSVTVQAPTFTGSLHGDGSLRTGDDGTWSGTLQGHDVQILVGDEVYRLDRAAASFRYDGETWNIESFTGQRRDAVVELRGVLSGSQGIDLAVEAAHLDLADDIPLLAGYGFAGPGSFSGRLYGRRDEIVLEGRAELGPGTVWGRPNVTGSGHIALSRKRLALADVHLWQYGGEFELEGYYDFAGAEGSGFVDLALRSDSGRVQELLAVLGWQLPVSGRMYGDISFAGTIGAVQAEGDVEVLEAVVWQQPLDRVAGRFTWSDGLVTVSDAKASLAMGTARVDGYYDVKRNDGQVGFSMENWPLGFTPLFEEHLGQYIGGTVNVHAGTLRGPVSSPQISGRLTAEALRVGSTLFRTVEGSFSYKDKSLELADMRGIRAGGGLYTLTGTITFAAAGEPNSELHLAVTDESLRSLLQLAKEDLPALFLDGKVSGEVNVTGSLTDPEATLELVLQESLALRHGVRIAMHYADGALRVRDLDLSATDS